MTKGLRISTNMPLIMRQMTGCKGRRAWFRTRCLIKNSVASFLREYCPDRVKQELGAITAARFIKVEHQLARFVSSIFRIAAELPIVGAGS